MTESMEGRRWIVLALSLVATLPSGARAQSVTPAASPAAATAATPASPGVFSSDLLPLSPGTPSIPLRHGNIIAHTEELSLAGTNLRAGTDYNIDYPSGTVYLIKPIHPGDSLMANYRYSTGPVATTSQFANGINSFQFGLLPGAMNVRFGFGLADREADGTVMRSNLYGFNTNYKLGMTGGGGLQGLMLFGDRQEVQAQSNFESTSQKGQNQKGKSRLILEGLSSHMLGGTFSANYQDVSTNFTGFSAAQGSGYDQAALDQLAKEKGLTRTAFGLTDAKIGDAKVSNGFKEVKDGANSIQWRNFGMQQGDVTIGWTQQSVSQKFSRFNDLAEADRANLQREQGTTRRTGSLGFALKDGMFKKGLLAGGTLNFTDFEVSDQNHGSIKRHEVTLASKAATLSIGNSEVQKEFQSMGNLLDPEKVTYGGDTGVRRQWLNGKLQVASKLDAAQVSQLELKSDTGKFKAEDFSEGNKSWHFNYGLREADKGFASFGALSPADTDANVNAIAAMYGPTVKANAPAERGAFALGSGLKREFFGGGLTPTKGPQFTFNSLRLSGAADRGSLETLGIVSGGLTANYRYATVGSKFTEVNNLLGVEKAQLGTVEGLKKSDFSLGYAVAKGAQLNIATMNADTPTGGASHSEVDFKNKTLDVSLLNRNVDSNFTTAGQLVDPQAGLLATIAGFKQSDSKINWTPVAGFKYNGEYLDSSNATTGVFNKLDNTNLTYDTKFTSLGYLKTQSHSNDPLSLLLANDQQKAFIKQAMGNFSMHAEHDIVSYAGTNAKDSAGNVLPDFASNTVGVELKVTKSTSLASELTATQYSDGQTASVRTDSVSTSLTPRAGLTVSNVQIDNNNDQKTDETKRNYGFWYDIAKGVRLSYGYIRDLNSTNNSTLNSVVTLGATPANGVTAQSNALGTVNQGTLGDLAVGGGYGANQWMTPNSATGVEATRTQAFSNIRLNTVKPLSLGNFKELKFNVTTDTASDNFNWIRENREGGFSGKFGQSAFGFDYHSQVNTQNEQAVDRTYTFATDPSEKHLVTGTFLYKVRTLPANQSVMIRNFDFKVHATERLTLSNQLMTNPEVANGGVILGSATQGAQVNRYKADYKTTPDLTFGGSWEELRNTANQSVGQTTGLNMTLFGSKSPLTLFYGWEAVDGNVPQHETQRWSFKFDQRAGPNQSFNLFLGNVSYGYIVPAGQSIHNLTAQIGYNLRLW